MVQHRGALGGDAHEEDPDLAVVLLAEPAVVLTGRAGAVIALLGKAALVDHTDRADRAADAGGHQFVGEHGLDLGLHVVVVPGSVVDEFLQGRGASVADVQGDRFDALSLGADHQSLDIDVRMILSLFLAEQGREPLVGLDQPLCRGAHFVLGHGGCLHTVA